MEARAFAFVSRYVDSNLIIEATKRGRERQKGCDRDRSVDKRDREHKEGCVLFKTNIGRGDSTKVACV